MRRYQVAVAAIAALMFVLPLLARRNASGTPPKGTPDMPMLSWAGKSKVVNHHNDVPFRVLERKWGYGDCSQISIEHNFSQITNAVGSRVPRDHNGRAGSPLPAAENMIIHGDNLAALKSLLPRYEGKVKCIYIDPPYNTGNEGWVYNDNVNDPQIKKWLGEVVGKEGEDFSRPFCGFCRNFSPQTARFSSASTTTNLRSLD